MTRWMPLAVLATAIVLTACSATGAGTGGGGADERRPDAAAESSQAEEVAAATNGAAGDVADAGAGEGEGGSGAAAGNAEADDTSDADFTGEIAIDAGNDSSSGSPAEPNATARTKLAATDPATVRLATGSPQLIEFFAHW